MALTFDCGASAAPTPQILAALEEGGVAATFFLTGRWAEQNPELTRKIANSHEVANHSYSHPDLAQLSDGAITKQLALTEEIVMAIADRGTKPLWRAPFGSRNGRVLEIAAQAGYPLHIFWTLDSGDWRAEVSAQTVYQRVTDNAGNGVIVVHHCGSPQTAAALPAIIAALQSDGYSLVTVSRLLEP